MTIRMLCLLGGLLGGVWILSGCAPAAVGGAAAGGYAVGSDERSGEQLTSDIRLSGRVNEALAKDSLLSALSIDVDVIQGDVTLSGVVKTDQQAQRAVELARSVEGVKSVRNNLQIGERTMSGRVSDSWISTQVKSKLVTEPGIRSLNIDVDVYQGVVTLTGLVGDSDQKTRAIELAEETKGVIRVVDNLKVDSGM